MDNPRIITIRDLIISSFSPELLTYDYPYWYFEGECHKSRDILMEIVDTIPGIIIEGFSLKKIDQNTYKYSVKFSFEEDKEIFNEVFNSQDDFEEE